jgi:hypothetical protein
MMKNWKNTIHALGIATCLIGAFLMAFGEPIIGTTHTGVATVVGITGIGIITTANKISFLGNKESQ